MRDKKFIAEHRGGVLTKEQHRQLIRWACSCVEHILPLLGETPDDRLKYALLVGREWERGDATVGDARKASLGAIALANQITDNATIAVARAAGHAVATAHMADHSMGAALYGLKAVKYAGKSIDEERKWQYEQLPSELREIVVTAMSLRDLRKSARSAGKKGVK